VVCAFSRGWVVAAGVGYGVALALAACSGALDSPPQNPSTGDAGISADASGNPGPGAVDGARPPDESSIGIDVVAQDDGASSDGGASNDDAGCSALGPVPDGAPRTFYGSCVPHLTPGEGICNAYGYTGNLGATALSVQIQKNVCSSLKGTWTDGPCDLDGAVFGCESLDNSGFVCETLSVTWFYPPHTTADEDSGCPLGTVIPP
jgi:hypothetical protein